MSKQVVLITGAGGSLGRELVKYLHESYQIIGMDNNEWACATLQNEYHDIKVLMKDFDKWRFDQDPCNILVHCAAYKHVNLCEDNPHDCIENNIIKTGKLFAEAFKNNVDILFISSDKAVEPCNTYGFSKAIGEKLCKHYNGSIARSGNFLGSSGSVIPIWEQCIAEGKPLPITDPKMTRYVIELPDAARQIWSEFLLGKKLIIPNMEKLTLNELKLRVLHKHNLNDDYPSKIIGPRPGEKMSEKLTWEGEHELK